MDFSTLDPQASLVITASRRQSRYIKEQYQHAQMEQGYTVWQSLDVMPWNAFLDLCWSLLSSQIKPISLPVRLSSHQSRYLWQQLVEASEAAKGLLNKKQTVSLSYDAWRTLCQWQMTAFDGLADDQDQAAFLDWFSTYRHLLEQKGWIDPHQQANFIHQHIEGIVDKLPQKIAFYGFEQATPQQEALRQVLGQKKQLLKLQQQAIETNQMSFKALASHEHEWLAAIRWAKNLVSEQASTESSASKTIAIIVPELEQHRANIERMLQQELYPKSFIGGRENYSLHDISVDEPLLKQPMAYMVKNVLQLLNRSLTKVSLQSLLLTPYLYHNKEQHWAATELELVVRQSTREYYSVEALLDLAEKKNIVLPWLNSVQQALNDIFDTITDYSTFIEKLLEFLSQLHWAGYHSLTSREYQVQQVLLDTIKASATLISVIDEKIGLAQAITTLLGFLEQQGFHQESPKAPIKIMGLLEAVGLKFDAAWLVGATDKVLPQKASPNPFLSKALQLKYLMPGSSQQREIDYAQAIVNSLKNSDQLVVSYAKHDGEQEQSFSPLFMQSQATIEAIDITQPHPDFIDELCQQTALETYADDKGIPIIDRSFTQGGTALLKVQAASPFDAYIRYRLNAYPLEEDPLGVSFMDRGNMFHQLMQMMWQNLKNQKTLLGYSDKELEQLINEKLDIVLTQASRHLAILYHAAFFKIEKQRLFQLAKESLELDKQRPDFTVIECEAKRVVEVAGLQLKITIDRIDELCDGSLVIIDYKTGQPKLMDLLNDPIGEPQLLLYAVSEHKETTPVSGIVFYQAHLKASKYIGLTDESEMLDGVKSLKDLKNNPYAQTFEQAIEQWRNQLNAIAEDFKQGNAAITDYSANYPEHYAISRWLERGELDEKGLGLEAIDD